jgi:hypothetical protein
VLVFGHLKDDETDERRSPGQSLYDENPSDHSETIHPQRDYSLDDQDFSLRIN